MKRGENDPLVNAHAGRAGTTKDEKAQFLLKGPSPGRLGPPEDGWVSIYCCYFRSKKSPPLVFNAKSQRKKMLFNNQIIMSLIFSLRLGVSASG